MTDNLTKIEFDVHQFSTVCSSLDESGYMVYVDSTVGSRARVFTNAPQEEIEKMLEKYSIKKFSNKSKVLN